ncbi:MAG: type 4a pilus biogenesis protein PilO [Fibromonadaceae bacterium]|jgi:type IV pilus assembly protein PilO|nr:type 4a pilus biogenesis protein PilO [Fibromonadaceae bacterium]
MAAKFDIKDKKNIYMLIAMIACLGSCYLFYSSVWTEFEFKKEKLLSDQKRAQEELDKINKQRSRIPMLEGDLQKAEIEFDRLKEMFPERENVPLRLQDLHSVVRASGVNVQTFKPNSSSLKEHYVENYYSFKVNAGYHMLGYLFAEIANFNYPTVVKSLNLNRSSAIAQEIKKADEHGWEPITMNVDFELTTFTSRKAVAEDPNAPASGSAKGKGNTKKGSKEK